MRVALLISLALVEFNLFGLPRITAVELDAFREILVVVCSIALALVNFWFYFRLRLRNGRQRLSEKFVSIFSFIVYFTVVLGVLFFDRESQASILILVVGLLATAGWMYTNYISLLNASTAHTMNILMQMRNSSELNMHRANIMNLIPLGSSVGPRMLERMKAGELRGGDENSLSLDDSILYVLNYYEFICAGTDLDQLNERLIRNTMRSIFVRFHDMVEIYIRDAITDDFGRKNDKIFEHFRAVVARFREEVSPSDMTPTA